jgi:prepilin-type N-terminal cleavage/methylation domain-containing protein/prepilin-type processing-associated H-X9-DG protein
MCQFAAQRGRPRPASGFTLVEVLVVIGIIAVLIGILLPVVSRIRSRALLTTCAANLRQINMAIAVYANDNNGRVVPADLMPTDPAKQAMYRLGNWVTILAEGGYLKVPDVAAGGSATRSVMFCPEGQDFDGFAANAYTAARDDGAQAGYWRRQSMKQLPDGNLQPGMIALTWYGINADLIGEDYPSFRLPSDTGKTRLRRLTELRPAADMVLVYDGFFHHDGRPNLMGHARHLNGTTTNYLFADGHVIGVPTKSLPASFDDADLQTVGSPKFKIR